MNFVYFVFTYFIYFTNTRKSPKALLSQKTQL